MVSQKATAPAAIDRHFRIGVVNASISTSVRRLLDSYTDLYREFLTDDPVTNVFI